MSVRVSRRRRQSNLCDRLGGIGVHVASTVVLKIGTFRIERRRDRCSEMCDI